MVNNLLKIDNSAIVQLISDAENAEMCRDLLRLRRVLSPIWENISENPNLEGVEIAFQAEILRLCGFYLSYYARARNLKDYQERGKSLLNKAIRLFKSLELPHKAAEAKVTLSLCCWHCGEIDKAEAILKEIEGKYSENKLHRVYLQVCANRLGIYFFNQEFDKSEQMIESLSVLVSLSNDLRLKTMFHNQAGLIARNLNKFDEALSHYKEAMLAARQAGNERYCAINYNNIGFVYKELGDFVLAHRYIDKAVNFYRELGEIGWFAQTLDSRACVYLAENKLDLALKTINESIEILKQGEDYAGHVTSLFTKCEILARFGEMEEIIKLSGEIQAICKQRIKESVADIYAKKIVELFSQNKKANKSNQAEVKLFDLSNFEVSFSDGRDFEGWAAKMPGALLPKLNITKDLLVLIQPIEKQAGQIVIVQNQETREFLCCTLDKDPFTGLFGIDAGEDVPLPLDKFKYFGKITGYSEFNKYKREIVFKPFE